MDLANARVEKREPLMIKDSKWITLMKISYVDADQKPRTWESMERLTRGEGSAVDAVGIVAVLERPSGPEILLQKQFRPPINKVCIEIPSGLMDEGETAEACAIRELKEETGYEGEVITRGGSAVSPLMFNDPGVCNTNLNVVHLSIDMTSTQNRNPTPSLEEDEFIEAFTVPLTDLYAECQKLESQGFAIDARVGTIAEGIELSKVWKLT